MYSTGHCSLENHARPDANYMEQAQIQTYTERESAFHLECGIGLKQFFCCGIIDEKQKQFH